MNNKHLLSSITMIRWLHQLLKVLLQIKSGPMGKPLFRGGGSYQKFKAKGRGTTQKILVLLSRMSPSTLNLALICLIKKQEVIVHSLYPPSLNFCDIQQFE